MSVPALRSALRDWADARDAANKGGGEFAAFARLIADGGDDDLEHLLDLLEFHTAEEALA